jgi:hypothetical protein
MAPVFYNRLVPAFFRQLCGFAILPFGSPVCIGKDVVKKSNQRELLLVDFNATVSHLVEKHVNNFPIFVSLKFEFLLYPNHFLSL